MSGAGTRRVKCEWQRNNRSESNQGEGVLQNQLCREAGEERTMTPLRKLLEEPEGTNL